MKSTKCIFSIFLLIAFAHSLEQPTQFQSKMPVDNNERTLSVTQTQNTPPQNLNQQSPRAAQGTPNQGAQNMSQMPMPSLNGMMAGNMMMGSAMMHPMMNPLSPANPFSPLSPGHPFSPLNPINQGAVPSGHFINEGEGEEIHSDDSGYMVGDPVNILTDVFDDASGLRVKNKCHSVKSQAVEIANRLMKKQNSKIFKELASYLIKSKFLIGMTEIKLTRALRKRVFGLMGAFSSLGPEHINFIDPEPVEDVDIDEKAIEPEPMQYDMSFADHTYPSIDERNSQDVEEEEENKNERKL